jgi:hypothetical protein
MLKAKFGDPRAYPGEMFVEGLRQDVREGMSRADEFRGIVKEADRMDFAYRDIGRPTGKLARDEVEKHLRISMPADAELRARVRTHGVALDANDIPAADGTKTIRISAGKAREAFEAMAREETDMTDELRADLLDVAASLATVDPEQMVRFESNPSDAHAGRVVLET